MEPSDFEYIERQLDVVLPGVFKDFVNRLPNEPTHLLQSDYGSIQINAELFVIAQLEHFKNDSGYDYYALQPDMRSRNFIYIGDDGCGNYFHMLGDDQDTNRLWMWVHDPEYGFCEQEGETLADYFDSKWELETQPDPFAPLSSASTIVSRATHPRRSILDPITMQEWHQYVEESKNLELDENFEATNPFTQAKDLIRRWPGRAKLTVDETVSQVSYHHGSLMLSDSNNSEVFREQMRTIAQDLNAKLF